MTATPSISVITVTWNLIEAGRRDAILDVMDCVQGQTATGLEHVIWDGASNDGTQALIEDKIATLRQGGAPVPVRFFSEPDSGLYDAMNKAVAASTGDYVIFLNSDDLIAEPDSLARMQEHLAKARSDYAFGETLFVDSDQTVKHVKRLSSKGILQSIPFCHNSTLIRRAVFQELGGHDLEFKIVADYDMVLRMILGGYSGSSSQVPIAVFRRGGISSDLPRTASEMVKCWKKNYQRYFDFSEFSDQDCLNWFRIGQLPLGLSAALYRAGSGNPVLRKAARYSFIKTLRRRLQPWRTWNNLEG
ncbi:glycosyltransferase [Rhodobacteraceae bacterium F11138]|nr:glycosyltransferase [Rhodobacteraceae bacterium F11138]